MFHKASLFAVLVLSLIFAGSSFAQEFSADMISTTRDGNFQGKIFTTKEKVRIEMPGSVVITRRDKKVTWVLIPEQKMYIEQPVEMGNMTVSSEKIPGEVERRFIGQEIIDGRRANKYSVTYTLNNRTGTVLIWEDIDLKILLKTQAGDGTGSVEYKNVKLDKQPDSLFELPSGYQRLSSRILESKMESGVTADEQGE